MKTKPYIGITGFKTTEEIKKVSEFFKEEGLENINTPFFGIHTTPNRIANVDSKGRLSPKVSDLKKLITTIPSYAIPIIHYSNKDNSGFSKELNNVLIESNCSAIQLNMAWPNLDDLLFLKEENPDLIYVMQIPAHAIKDMTGQEIKNRVRPYNDLADYVLVDLSSGKGIEFDTNQSKELLKIAKEAIPNSKPAIAGGLNGENIYQKIKDMEMTNLSFDAQSGLITNDNLDMEKVKQYIHNSRGLK